MHFLQDQAHSNKSPSMRTFVFAIVIPLLSIGWLVPLWFAVDCLITWANHEQLALHGNNSFPYLSAAHDSFKLAFVWLGIVVLLWSFYLGSLAAKLRRP
jgi:hypothetical protein